LAAQISGEEQRRIMLLSVLLLSVLLLSGPLPSVPLLKA
jgi:hypothetical protein